MCAKHMYTSLFAHNFVTKRSLSVTHSMFLFPSFHLYISLVCHVFLAQWITIPSTSVTRFYVFLFYPIYSSTHHVFRCTLRYTSHVHYQYIHAFLLAPYIFLFVALSSRHTSPFTLSRIRLHIFSCVIDMFLFFSSFVYFITFCLLFVFI